MASNPVLTRIASGAKASEIRYCEASLRDKPWGETRYSSGTTATPYQYTGQFSNMSDFGLLFFNARWVDPVIGRFSSPDSIIPQSQGVQAWDRYAFVNNNPLRYTDPSGHFPIPLFLVMIAGALILTGDTPQPSASPLSERKGLPFGDIFPDAQLTSYTGTAALGITGPTSNENQLAIGVDIVETKDEIGIFHTSSVNEGCPSNTCCVDSTPNPNYFSPNLSITKIRGAVWGDSLKLSNNGSVTEYGGIASVYSFGAGPFSLEMFSSVDIKTGNPNYKVIEIGVGGGAGLAPVSASIYYAEAESDWGILGDGIISNFKPYLFK